MEGERERAREEKRELERESERAREEKRELEGERERAREEKRELEGERDRAREEKRELEGERDMYITCIYEMKQETRGRVVYRAYIPYLGMIYVICVTEECNYVLGRRRAH